MNLSSAVDDLPGGLMAAKTGRRQIKAIEK
jgi:hypothetical protein